MSVNHECKYLSGTVCRIASHHAELTVHTTQAACAKCQKQMCSVPASLALTALGTPIPNSKKYLLQYIVKTYRILLTEGVGTELSKLIKILTPWIKWLYPLADIDAACDSCNKLKYRLNDWTTTEIKNNLSSILSEMEQRAKEQHIPYSKFLYKGLIYVAIYRHARNVRKSFRNKLRQESRTSSPCEIRNK